MSLLPRLIRLAAYLTRGPAPQSRPHSKPLATTVSPSVSRRHRPGHRLRQASCSSASACAAVGVYEDSSLNPFMLAEAWNGKAWHMQTAPNPAGAVNSFLSGVSCSSTTACTAVGNYTDNTFNPLTLAEAWNGTAWHIQATPNPTGGLNHYLSGVACRSATACTAVGNYTNTSGIRVTLAEEHG